MDASLVMAGLEPAITRGRVARPPRAA